MFGSIKNFQTISRHEAKLRQSPATIECLTNVLNYIRTVLTDDSTQLLVDILNNHINTKEAEAHYENLDLMGKQLIKSIRDAYISLIHYTNEEISDAVLYNVNDIIPDGDAFVKWLINNSQIYADVLPSEYDEYNHGLSVKLVKDFFEANHNEQISAHENSLQEKLDELLTICNESPIYTILPLSFQYVYYRIVDITTFTNLMQIISTMLNNSGNPQTIDFTTYVDTSEETSSYGYTQEIMIINDFLLNMYDDDQSGTIIIQYDIDSLEAKEFGGELTLVGYKELLNACGETDDRIFKKKYTDYYLNHLQYVLTDTMTPEYRAELTSLRGNVHTNYSKVNNVFTLLNQNNFTFYLTISLSHLIQDKTMDIINVVGLTKSIACISLIPYTDGVIQYNKLVISFDNYNPEFTAVIIDGIVDNDIHHLSIVVSMTKTKMIVYTELNNLTSKYEFLNTNRMFDVFPFFFYIIPRIDNYLNGTNRITQLKFFGKALTESDATAILAGFSQ